MPARSHSDMLLGQGVLADTLAHFHTEALRKGTAEAWKTAYDKTSGVDFLWIVYTTKLRNAGDKTSGLFESIALSNHLRTLMDGLDEYEHTPGGAAEYRARMKALWDATVDEARRRRDAA